MKFHEWFQRELRRREWSQADFVRRAAVGQSTVHSWFHGTRTPDPASCDLIADVFGLRVDDVLERAGHRPSSGNEAPVSEARETLIGLVMKIDWDSLSGDYRHVLRTLKAIEEDQQRERGGASSRA